MYQAVLNGVVVAEAAENEVVHIEGNVYFPPTAVNDALIQTSRTPYNCPWKGDAQYFSVADGATWLQDRAWSYPTPLASAITRVGQDFSGYIAFWKDVSVRSA